MIIFKCDHCGLTSGSEIDVRHFKVEKFASRTSYNLFLELHLCQKCSDEFRLVLDQFKGNSQLQVNGGKDNALDKKAG
jgi:hypothetical protein